MKRDQVISQYVAKWGWTLGIEIGVWRGHTFFGLLETHPNLYMVGVDQWRIVPGIKGAGYSSYENKDVEMYGKRVEMRAWSYGNRARILHMSSIEAAELILDNSVDFIFIDSDHRSSFVRADIAVWLPKIKKNGILFGHDWDRIEVKEVLDQMLPGWKKLDNVEMKNDHVWCVKRRRIVYAE